MRMKILHLAMFILLLAFAHTTYNYKDLIDAAIALIKTNLHCYLSIFIGLHLFVAIYGLWCREWGYKEGVRRTQLKQFLKMNDRE